MKNYFKFLLLAASIALLSSACYATEAKQNMAQVSGIECSAYDVGWFEAPVVYEYTAYGVEWLGERLMVFKDFKDSNGFNDFTKIRDYADKIFGDPLHSDPGRERGDRCGYTEMALIAASGRTRVEASWIYRPDTFGRYGGATCTKQRRC